MALLRDVIEAEEIRLDRWTVVFRPQSEESEGADGRVTAASAQAWGSILFSLAADVAKAALGVT